MDNAAAAAVDVDVDVVRVGGQGSNMVGYGST